MLLLFVWHSVSFGRCSLFPSRDGLRTYQHRCVSEIVNPSFRRKLQPIIRIIRHNTFQQRGYQFNWT